MPERGRGDGDRVESDFSSRKMIIATTCLLGSTRWFYYPDMQPHEVLAFRLCDTADADLHMTAHTAFDDPTSRPGSPKRMSYELRTIAVMDG